MEPLLVVEKLVKEYPRKGGAKTFGKLFGRKPAPEPDVFRAVDGISFAVNRGESVGLVGEFGLRQIHHLDHGDAPHRQERRRHHVRRRGYRGDPGQAVCPPAAAQAHPDWCSRTRPTASIRGFTAVRAIADPILQLGDTKGRDAVRTRLRGARPPGRPSTRSA